MLPVLLAAGLTVHYFTALTIQNFGGAFLARGACYALRSAFHAEIASCVFKAIWIRSSSLKGL